MQVEIKDGNLHIVIPVNNPLEPSKTGKSRMVASTHGTVTTTVLVEGKPLKVGLNSYIEA
jgi:hypothetical protein